MSKIIIVGAGFTGLRLAQRLNNTEYDVWLLNKQIIINFLME